MVAKVFILRNSDWFFLKAHNISIERPDSWDDYCVSNTLILFKGTKILMRINFQNLITQVKSATASVDMISIIASFWIKLENPVEVNS